MLHLRSDNPFVKFKTRNLILLFFIISIELAFLSSFLEGLFNWNSDEIIFYHLSYCLTMILVCVWSLHKFHQLSIHPKYLLGKFKKSDRWLFLWGISIAICLFTWGIDLLFLYSLSLLSPSLTVNIFNYFLYVPPFSNSSFPILAHLLNAITLIVVAPVTEEFIFRGIFLHKWAIKWGVSSTILISSTVFGLCHIVPLGAAVFGILMTLLYLKTRTLITPIIAHAINNAIALIVELLFPTQQISTSYNFSEYLYWGVALTLVSAPFVIRFVYRNWYKQQLTLPYFTNESL